MRNQTSTSGWIEKTLKLLTPPIVIWGYRKVINTKEPSAGKVFTGQFGSFEELRTKLKSETNYYWPGAIVQEFNAQKQRISEWKSECPPSGNYRTNFLPAALSLFTGSEIRVLDMGGGLNNSFEYLKFSLRRKVRVTVFDQSPAVENGKRIYGDVAGLQFTETIPDGKDCFDVVYFGSSIQYFPDYRQTLAKVIGLNPQLIVISDSAFGKAETFVCAQVNMPGAIIPYTVINKIELEDLARTHGYELVHQSINDSGSDYFSSYEYPLNQSRSWNLIFGRIDKAKS